MRLNGKLVIAALPALLAFPAGVVVATTLLTGAATSGARAPLRGPATAPLRGPATAPTPFPSVTIPPGVPDAPADTAPVLTVEVASCIRYGPILVTPAGKTVYRLAGGGASGQGYQPLLAAAHQRLRLPVLVGGRLGTVTSSRGGRQVTYDGSPLYVYSGDHAQGDTNGAGPRWRVIPLAP